MSEFEHVYEPGTSGWTAVLLHGTGGDRNDLVPLGRQLAPGAAILSPDGKELENGVTRRFFKRRSALDLDIPDLLAVTDEMAGFLKDSVTNYGLDPDRLLAIGLSNGANLIVSLLFRHPGLLRAGLLLRPMLPYRPEDLSGLEGTDVLVASGAQDPYVAEGMSEELVSVLEAGGARVSFELNEVAGHGLAQEDLIVAGGWTARLLQDS